MFYVIPRGVYERFMAFVYASFIDSEAGFDILFARFHV